MGNKKFYTLAEKESIVQEAYSVPLNIRKTSLKFNIQPKQIREWKRKIQSISLDDSNKNKLTSHEGTISKHYDYFDNLEKYFDEMRDAGRKVSVSLLVNELRRVDSSCGEVGDKVLWQRVYRWCLKKDLVNRRVTHVAQNTRFNMQIINDFGFYVKERIQQNSIDYSSVVNIDETNVYFDMCGSTTLSRRGERSINLKNTGSSYRATVILGVTLSGEKLPPYVIFKGKPNGRIIRSFSSEIFPSNIFYDVQDKAWVDEPTFLKWISSVWTPFSRSKGSSYLVMDEFKVHLMLSCIKKIQESRSEVDFIPAGYTSQLQPLDVEINKPFKDLLRNQYEQWMRENLNNPDLKPKREDIARWINFAWNCIDSGCIKNSWRKAGVSFDTN